MHFSSPIAHYESVQEDKKAEIETNGGNQNKVLLGV